MEVEVSRQRFGKDAIAYVIDLHYSRQLDHIPSPDDIFI